MKCPNPKCGNEKMLEEDIYCGECGTQIRGLFERKAREEIPGKYTNSISMNFVLISAGEFMMGSGESGNTKPVHKVTIKKPFYLGIYPVTQREWKEVMRNNPSKFKGDDLPVENVSWHDIQEFVRILNEKESTNKYRLPSEAEWEYAARAGTATWYSFGDDESKLGEYAWYNANSGGKTHPVGQKNPNPWGLYDMHGNVLEWVQDRWNGDYRGASDDGSARESGGGFFDNIYMTRVIRGGSWDGFARDCRSAYRWGFTPGERSGFPSVRDGSLGFRLLRGP